MARRKISHRKLQKYSIGDMRHRITIHERAITPPTYADASFTETYDDGIEDWAFVGTPTVSSKGIVMFNGVNLPETATHIFVIRFDETFTTENIIRWEGDAYKILKTNDPDKRQQYLECASRLLGDETLDANT